MSFRQGSAAGQRPLTSRPMSSAKVPGTAVGPVPGTASRLISTAMQRPASKAGVGQGVSLNAQIKIAERPISQQGLATGIKTASRAPQRQVQDKSYYMGILRAKMADMGNEVISLNKQIESMNEEHSSYTTHEKRAEELATELKNLSAEMADYNMLVDKLNTDTEKEEVEMECEELREQNDVEANNIDQLFVEKQEKEGQIKQLEKEIEQELHMADNLVAAMTPALRQKYSELKSTNVSLHSRMESMQQKLDGFQSRKVQLEDELSMSHIKQEALSLHQKLRELEEKRNELLSDEQERGTPAQERERLLQQVKDDNQEIASIDKQTNELEDQINKLRDEIVNAEQDLEEHHGERNQKYVELKKKEETMDGFLSNFDEVYQQEVNRLDTLESNIVGLTERISRNLVQFDTIPDSIDYESLKTDVALKEGEVEKSKSTVLAVNSELHKLSLDLQKIEELESKIDRETETLEEKMRTMEGDILVYDDVEALKKQAEEKRNFFVGEKDLLSGHKQEISQVLSELESHYNDVKNELDENETHKQLVNLERKLQHLEQNNFILKEFIANKSADSDYKRLSRTVCGQVQDYNRFMQELLTKPSHV